MRVKTIAAEQENELAHASNFANRVKTGNPGKDYINAEKKWPTTSKANDAGNSFSALIFRAHIAQDAANAFAKECENNRPTLASLNRIESCYKELKLYYDYWQKGRTKVQ